MHRKNTQILTVEIYKHIHGLSPAIMREVFKINRTLPYNLIRIFIRIPETVKYGTETFFLAPKVWTLEPGKIEECFSLEAFKSKIRKWKPNRQS